MTETEPIPHENKRHLKNTDNSYKAYSYLLSMGNLGGAKVPHAARAGPAKGRLHHVKRPAPGQGPGDRAQCTARPPTRRATEASVSLSNCHLTTCKGKG